MYEGYLNVKFTIKEAKDVFLDFHGYRVKNLHINDDLKNTAFNFKDHKIELFNLKQGDNRVQIWFENYYVTNSAGLHKFSDPEDGSTYLYTHLEPFFCNCWFPCFDQPSFRAPLHLFVLTHDPDWKVFANSPIKKAEQIAPIQMNTLKFSGETGTYTEFEESPAISTYLYGMDVGPFGGRSPSGG